MLRVIACALLVACSSPAPTPIAPTPPPTGSDTGSDTGSNTGSDTSASPSLEGLGDKCGESDACGTGQTCVHYFGIAGPSGPELTSCEITCKDNAPCPAGTKCITIADGPGQVCRP
ncbi:MAG: hypothetical protein AB7T06_06305 [Kofleriaceae bacterium]